ncbi:MAG: NAD(P)H-binding protein [Chloroflexi bacterium]|nr:NAD(P)H-binding protein [Chloroflexota bacterium]
MNIAVIGATGNTGFSFTEQAIERGHSVTALVRSPEKLASLAGQLNIIKGSVLNTKDVAQAVTGQDAVFIALGTGKYPKKSRIRTDGTRQVVKALQASGEQPLVVALSSLGVGESQQQIPFYWRWPLNIVLMYAFADHNQQESVLRESRLPYVIVRPTFMNDDESDPSQIKAAAAPHRVKASPAVPRANVAAFALDAMEKRNFDCQTVALTT